VPGRLLIVEDEEAMLHVLQVLLQDEGYETVGVDTVAAAVAYLAANSVACVVLDVRLPDGSAEDVMTWMITHDVRSPTVLISASRTAEELGARYGVPVVVKPDIDAIIGAVAMTIRDGLRPQHVTGG
jgi:DNA-binding NtrC family response regulator